METHQHSVGPRSLTSRTVSGLTAAAVLVLTVSGCGTSGSTGSGGSSGGAFSSDSSDSPSSSSSSSSSRRQHTNSDRPHAASSPSRIHSSSASATRIPSTIRAKGLVSFQLIAGQASWQAGAKRKAVNAVLTLRNGGSCRFDTVDTVGTPLPCTYTVEGDQISFSGADTTPGAAGSSSLQVSGSVDLSGHTMEIELIGTSGMAAVVNNQSFAQSTAIHWNAVVSAGF